MGRRSQHTPEELRELILTATRRIVEERGFRALSAREIAREIGYAPGTLYNMYENLSEILLRVECRVLQELDDHIGESLLGKKPPELLHALGAAYADFAYDNPRLWELVQFHHPELEKTVPEWYLDALYAPVMRLEMLVGNNLSITDPDEIARYARKLWSVIHGIVQIATTPKFGIVQKSTTIWMIHKAISDCTQNQLPPKPHLRVEPQSNGKRERRAS